MQLIKDYYPNSKIIVITPITRKDNTEMKPYGNVRLVDDIIKNHAESFGFDVIDGMKMLPQAEEFMNDGVHPNGFGFSLLGKNLSVAIKALLS